MWINKKKFFVLVPLLTLSFVGCSHTNVEPKKTDPKLQQSSGVKGYTDIDQNISLYTKGINKGYIGSFAEYKKRYFRIWRKQPIFDKKDAMWAYRVFHAPRGYGENKQILPQSFYTKMLHNANFNNFATLNKKAYTLRRTNLRVFPTSKALFYNPKKAGEGFPFDYLQNSSIAPYKPLFISHYSLDKGWAYVTSSFAQGWVRAQDIKLISDQEAKKWQESLQQIIVQDDGSVTDKDNKFLFYSQIGQMLPKICHLQTDSKNYYEDILPFNEQTIAMILQQLQDGIYGWGGLYNERDCSSTMRDFFAPFGVWLPRNSKAQSRVGKVIVLKGMDDATKLKTIKQYGVPFETLLYKRGHIVLYLGTFNDNVLVFQNMWGITTRNKDGKSGRYIIGKPVITTIDFGNNIAGYDPKKSSLLHKIESMNIVTQK